MHVDFGPIGVDWSRTLAEPPATHGHHVDEWLRGSSMGGGVVGGAAPSYPVFTPDFPINARAGGIGSMFRKLPSLLGANWPADNLSRQRSAASCCRRRNHGGAPAEVVRGGGGGDCLSFNLLSSRLVEQQQQQQQPQTQVVRHLDNQLLAPSLVNERQQPAIAVPKQKSLVLTHWVPSDQSVQSVRLAFNSALERFCRFRPPIVSVSRSFFRELLPLSTISHEGP
ncbi:hypothetical protein niasHT_016580 [Heterodera trifolii]|uniref:Uncharacterized protein n=1 Tax=Heterodera trifolii TaxID=157864 RepID=A0ABD2LBK2_9BILA